MGWLCDIYDIILLQELWLSSHDMYLLKTIHKEFDGYGVSSMDMESGFLSGRPCSTHTHSCNHKWR